MNAYLIASTIIFLLLGIIWKKNDFQNFLIKFILIAMGITGLLLTLQAYGYIIKA